MAYCRFGRDSDVYVYEHVHGYWMIDAGGSRQLHLPSAAACADALEALRAHGYRVPLDGIAELWAESCAGEWPRFDGLLFADGRFHQAIYRAVEFRGRAGSALRFGVIEHRDVATIKDTVCLGVNAALCDCASRIQYSCGRTPSGGEGFILARRADEVGFTWMMLLGSSGSLEQLELCGDELVATSDRGHRWRVRLDDPPDVTVD